MQSPDNMAQQAQPPFFIAPLGVAVKIVGMGLDRPFPIFSIPLIYRNGMRLAIFLAIF
jgi:hypothetical protein